MIETPRTNAARFSTTPHLSLIESGEQLERELAAARREAEALERERDSIRELLAIHNMGGETDYNIGPMKRALQAEAERDEARAEAKEWERKYSRESYQTECVNMPALRAAEDSAEKARAEAEALRADAERIDWLESHVSAIRDIGWISGPLRLAIDAARSANER